jgi:hypothetical protein
MPSGDEFATLLLIHRLDKLLNEIPRQRSARGDFLASQAASLDRHRVERQALPMEWASGLVGGNAAILLEAVFSGSHSFCLSTSSTHEKIFIMVGKPSVVVPNKATW